MKINIIINEDVPVDEVSYILSELSRSIEVSGLPSSVHRVFDSNGDPVGTVEVSLTVPVQAPESPVEA